MNNASKYTATSSYSVSEPKIVFDMNVAQPNEMTPEQSREIYEWKQKDSSISGGVSKAGVQYGICYHGHYGGRQQTLEEREAACKEFEVMTGIRLTPPDNTPGTALATGVVIFALVVGAVLGYMLCKYRMARKGSKQPKAKRSRRRKR